MSRDGVVILLFVVLTGAALAGCRPTPAQAPPELVATVGGDDVRWEEFETYLERHLGESGASLGSDVLSELFDQYLSERLLVRLAIERGLAAAGAEANGASRRRAVDRLLAAEDGARDAPTDEETAAFYAAHRDDFQRPERVRLRQILLDDRAAADQALAELRAGADFEELGARLAADPTIAAEAGPQGELSRDDLPRAFADAIFALAPGEISEVVAADYGFHLFQVVERLPSEVVPLEEARTEIVRRLHQEAADRRLEALIEQARRRYDVAVHDRNLPFNYRGRYLDG
ncbi:MAG TPA: peptidyl-prolyl cis-trans isomerase [Thermoanaerobaculia bacterium]